MTEKYYFQDLSCLTLSATITAVDHERFALMLDKTIFHTKGGGQLADSGTIDNTPVLTIFQDENGDILHVIDEDKLKEFSINQVVNLKVDAEKRALHSRLHSAGHLLAGVVEKLYSGFHIKAVSGNHIPGQCRVIFEGDQFPEKAQCIADVEAAVEAAIKMKHPITIDKNSDNVRIVMIDTINTTLCGGTHVNNLSEIGNFSIRKYKKKGNQLQLGYTVE